MSFNAASLVQASPSRNPRRHHTVGSPLTVSTTTAPGAVAAVTPPQQTRAVAEATPPQRTRAVTAAEFAAATQQQSLVRRNIRAHTEYPVTGWGSAVAPSQGSPRGSSVSSTAGPPRRVQSAMNLTPAVANAGQQQSRLGVVISSPRLAVPQPVSPKALGVGSVKLSSFTVSFSGMPKRTQSSSAIPVEVDVQGSLPKRTQSSAPVLGHSAQDRSLQTGANPLLDSSLAFSNATSPNASFRRSGTSPSPVLDRFCVAAGMPTAETENWLHRRSASPNAESPLSPWSASPPSLANASVAPEQPPSSSMSMGDLRAASEVTLPIPANIYQAPVPNQPAAMTITVTPPRPHAFTDNIKATSSLPNDAHANADSIAHCKSAPDLGHGSLHLSSAAMAYLVEAKVESACNSVRNSPRNSRTVSQSSSRKTTGQGQGPPSPSSQPLNHKSGCESWSPLSLSKSTRLGTTSPACSVKSNSPRVSSNGHTFHTSPGPQMSGSSILQISAKDHENERWSSGAAATIAALPPDWEQPLGEIFDQCAARYSGCFNKRQLIKIVQTHFEIAEFFGLPHDIQQIDASGELLEQFFQDIDDAGGKGISWAEAKSFYARASAPVPAAVSEAARVAARSCLQTEFQIRLQALEARLANAATEEVRVEVMRMAAAERCATESNDAGDEIDFSMPTEQLVARLQAELQVAKARARKLWDAVEAQDATLQQLQSAALQPSQQSSSSEDLEIYTDLAESRRESSAVEAMIACAQEEATEAQSHSRQLDASNGRLQRELQAAKVELEERWKKCCTPEESKAADACKQLRIASSRLEAEVLTAAMATEAFCERSSELEHTAERLHSEKEAAAKLAKQQGASRQALWNRLASLTSVRGVAPQPDASISDLVEIIGTLWTEGQRRSEWQQRDGLFVEERRRDLEGQLDIAREAANQAASRREASASEYNAKGRGRRGLERRASEDLVSAQVENALLSENRLEWRRTRPQLEALIEELHAGCHESKGTAQSLGERLAFLRSAVELQKPETSALPSAPSSPIPMSPPRSPSHSRDGSPINTKARRELQFGAVGAPNDSPARGGLPNQASHPVLADARESEDPLIRKAAEESDQLHKRVLALEDERASLIRSQEELLQYIKDKVEPVQRALHQ